MLPMITGIVEIDIIKMQSTLCGSHMWLLHKSSFITVYFCEIFILNF